MSETNHYLAFLAYCLNPERDVPKCVSAINWHALLSFARKHAITGVYGRVLLHDEKLQRDIGFLSNKPTDDDVLEWMAKMFLIQKRNEKLNEASVKISKHLEEQGFRTCILKGQGNGLLYPDGMVRASGDVDVWMWPKQDKRYEWSFKQRKQAIANFVHQQFPGLEVATHHVDYPMLPNIPVEAHFTPLFLMVPWQNKKLQRYWQESAPKNFSNFVELYNSGRICKPVDECNVIFQLLHMKRHFLADALGLRQVVDFYYLLKSIDRSKLSDDFNRRLHDFGIARFSAGMMFILHNVLGLNANNLISESNSREGEYMLRHILESGNMAKTNETLNDIAKSNNHLERFVRREAYHWRKFGHFPIETFWGTILTVRHFFSKDRKGES